MTFTLSFETDNAAFEGDNKRTEIARVLRHVAARIEQHRDDSGNVRDINGNLIGSFEQ